MIRILLNSTNIKIILAKKNKDLKWLAQQVGISRSYLSMWLSGLKSPRPHYRKKIQKALGGNKKWEEVFKIICQTNTTGTI